MYIKSEIFQLTSVIKSRKSYKFKEDIILTVIETQSRTTIRFTKRT